MVIGQLDVGQGKRSLGQNLVFAGFGDGDVLASFLNASGKNTLVV
ncbi:hypothetical protein [Noviherbaspirillum sp. Root189]|nr:hypothetical protein [Noviherbaspirillum sp. Root189]